MTGQIHCQIPQTFKKELPPMPPKLLYKIEEEGKLSNSSYKARINLLLNQLRMQTKKKENYRLISPMNTDAKIPNKILVN
jgi:hypothetical protein